MHIFRLLVVLAVVVTGFVGLMGGQASAQGSLVIAQGTDAVTLDAHYITDSPSATVAEHVIEPLFELTPAGDIVPKLVESYAVSDDSLTWTLQLRQGIEFHDGTPFNAEAVAYNLNRILDPDNAVTFRFLISRITSVDVMDEYTIELTTETPFAPMLAHLTHSSIGMQSPAAMQAGGEDYARSPVGTGPFVFKEWVRGNRIVLERNDQYWGEKPTLDEVVFRVVPEDGPRMLMVQTGEAHVAVRVPPDDVPVLEARDGVHVVNTPSVRTIYIGFNNYQRADQDPNPFTDQRVRQAVNYAVDNAAINEFILGGLGRPSDAPISPGIFGYDPIYTYEYDPEKARELLAAAGYPDGFQTQLYSPSGRYLKDLEISEAVQSQLSEVGIEAEVVTMEWATYLEVTGRGPDENEVPMFMLGWGTVTGDADYGLYALFHSSQWVPGGSHRAFYQNERVDELLDLARTIPDANERAAMYREAMALIMEEAPWLFLHAETQLTAIRDEVEGVIVHPTERIIATQARFK